MFGRLLIVEDEPDLAEPLAAGLQSEGHDVSIVSDGEACLREVWSDDPPDLVVLDLMLPRVSGLEVCRRIRSDPRTSWMPVLMVTARAEEYDKVLGFEAGADDYVTKPFSLREVRLRVSALLRRTRDRAAPVVPGVFRSGDVALDESAHTLTIRGRDVPITVTEFRLLAVFLRNAGRALTREQIRDLTWGETWSIHERAVDTNVRRLRLRLGALGARLETVRGVGYRWTEEG